MEEGVCYSVCYVCACITVGAKPTNSEKGPGGGLVVVYCMCLSLQNTTKTKVICIYGRSVGVYRV